MRSIYRVSISYVIAALIGFSAAIFFCVRPLKLDQIDNTVFSCESDLIVLGLVNQGNLSELVRRKEARLKLFAKILSSEHANHPGAEYFLWKIHEYFKNRTNGVPAELRPYFSKLPATKPAPSQVYYRGN